MIGQMSIFDTIEQEHRDIVYAEPGIGGAVHCLFEQSGTFKNEFRKMGFPAYDYDIQNDFGQTDYVIDLFAEIEKAYAGEDSIFDGFTENDLLIAFFPCVRFENQINLLFRGQNYSQITWSIGDKVKKCMILEDERNVMYQNFCKLFLFAEEKG